MRDMQAMKVHRLDLGTIGQTRYYLNGMRVKRGEFEMAHLGRSIDSLASVMHTRRDGSILVREYHCIRSK